MKTRDRNTMDCSTVAIDSSDSTLAENGNPTQEAEAVTHADMFNIISSIIGGVATVILGGLFSMVRGLRTDFRRFMGEHLYLLRIADWTKVNLANLFDHLNLTPTEPPPILPNEKHK